MKIERIGYGAGQKDLRRAAEHPAAAGGRSGRTPPADDADQVCVLETNLDDISGELIGYCIDAAVGGWACWTCTPRPSR